MTRVIQMQTYLTILKRIFIILCIIVTLGAFIYYHQNSLKTTYQANYVIRVDKCQKDTSIFMVVLVGSHPDHVEIRNAIRRTWGNPGLKNYKFKLVFLFGKVPSAKQQSQLQTEHEKYRDILEGTFVDSFNNITLRDLMGLHWASQHCQHARYILRADDDIALDIFRTIHNLEIHYSKVRNLIACFKIMTLGEPQRSGRYFISVEDYPYTVYDDYCEGWAYVLTPNVAHKIVMVDAQRKSIWPNDIYLAGLLIKALGLRHQLLHLQYTYSYEEMVLLAQTYDNTSDSDILYDIGPAKQDDQLILKMNEIYKRRAMKEGFVF